MKKRLDMLMMERALAPSREKAKAYIMAGDVYVDGQKEDKAGTMFPETVKIEVRGNTLPYVSRGGLKLEKAMKNFDVTLDGKVCMDVGASTGGFTDCMLQNGAVKVYSIDVGYGQLDWKLRNDPRVVCMEKTNIRYVTSEQIPEKIDFASVDVSFISLKKVLGPARELLQDDATMFICPLPGMLQEFVTGKICLLDTLCGQFIYYLRFRSDRSVVSTRYPAGIFTFHTGTAYQNILYGIIKHVSHVQHTGDVGGRDDDGVRLTTIGFRTE